MSADLDPDLKVFDSLYAVVLHGRLGGRLRWSPEEHGWLRWSSIYGVWEPAVDPSVSPDDEDLRIGHSLAARSDCMDCGGQSAMHFIEADPFGRPTRYCVARPSAAVVGSGGTKKHWGSPHGCLRNSAYQGEYYEYERHDGVSWPGGWFLYGEPLSADLVIASEWCSRCTGAARNVAAHYGLFAGTPEEQAAAWDGYAQDTTRRIKMQIRAVSKAWSEFGR
ncbi:hypothetical protein ACIGB8_24185 [Promicromonospora sukumoe]|uniref:hypothetical protein n=1 Tax=Promicromonospora sukumoe TaxID=88382 RepID=UPI0037C5A51B